jgi:hypothetical protein
MFAVVLAALLACATGAQPERIWLSHARSVNETMMVNWETVEEEASLVEFGSTPELGTEARASGRSRLHHVQIPLAPGGVYYRVRSGDAVSAVHFVRGYSEPELRVAIVADIGYAKAKLARSRLSNETASAADGWR